MTRSHTAGTLAAIRKVFSSSREQVQQLIDRFSECPARLFDLPNPVNAAGRRAVALVLGISQESVLRVDQEYADALDQYDTGYLDILRKTVNWK